MESELAALEVLASHLPNVNTLLADSFTAISAEFMTLASQIQQQRQWVQKLIAQTPGATETHEAIEAIHLAQSQSISTLITALQFQDRVSQNLVITVNVLRAVCEHLKQEIDQAEEIIYAADGAARIDVALARQLMALLNLGELKKQFVDHLLHHGYIASAAEVGYEPAGPEAAKQADDIDLF